MSLKKLPYAATRLITMDAAKVTSLGASASSPNGYLEGYLAVFGNVDQYGDRIIPGAFAKTITERVPAGKVPLVTRHFAHGGDGGDAIGLITFAKEDDYGLWIHADYSADVEAQRMRNKIEEGLVWGLSVGYELIRYQEVIEEGHHILELLEMKLLEGTVTCRPANELAVITAAKSLRSQLSAAGASGRPAQGSVEELSSRLDAFLTSVDGAAAKVTSSPEPVADFAIYEEALLEMEITLAEFDLNSLNQKGH